MDTADTLCSDLTQPERATVLAALRLWQQTRPTNPDLVAIATNGGAFKSLGPYEIDELCERIN